MDMIWIILAFGLFAVLTDAIESRKKKRGTQAGTEKRPFDFSFPKKKQPVDIPEIREVKPDPGLYREPEPVMIEETAEEINKYQKFLAEKEQLEKENRAAYEREQAQLHTQPPRQQPPADIHTNVILNAIAYEQILGRPRAWRQLGGRWRNLDNR